MFGRITLWAIPVKDGCSQFLSIEPKDNLLNSSSGVEASYRGGVSSKSGDKGVEDPLSLFPLVSFVIPSRYILLRRALTLPGAWALLIINPSPEDERD